MNKSYILALALCAASCSSVTSYDEAQMLNVIPTEKVNINYVSNRAPLQPMRFIKLPVGSIRPEGWVRTMLELQRDGLNGHLGEISAWLQKEDNAWLKSGGKWGWEEVPYWLRGYAEVAYLLEDERMLKEAKTWIEAILGSNVQTGILVPISK